MTERQQREQVRHRHVAGDERHDADDQQRRERRDAENALRACGLRRAAVLQFERDEKQNRRDDECRVDSQGKTRLDEAEIRNLELPMQHRRIGGKETRERIAGREAAAEREHRRPREPVAPHRNRGNQLAVSNPADRAIHRRAARFMRKQPRYFRISRALDQAHRDRGDPDRPRGLADRRAYAADREQHACRHAARYPEAVFPCEAALQRLAFGGRWRRPT
ncbi:hypothetical protein BTE28158_03904 [Burkholderia territorii]|nr:hypothetical protein BTE28158_03904 [Burkholderia territorii]